MSARTISADALPLPPLDMRKLVGPTDEAEFDNPTGDLVCLMSHSNAGLPEVELPRDSGREGVVVPPEMPPRASEIGLEEDV